MTDGLTLTTMSGARSATTGRASATGNPKKNDTMTMVTAMTSDEAWSDYKRPNNPGNEMKSSQNVDFHQTEHPIDHCDHDNKSASDMHNNESFTSHESDCVSCGEADAVTNFRYLSVYADETEPEPTTYSITTTDRQAHMRMLKADDLYAMLWDIDMKMRSLIKHYPWMDEDSEIETQLECWREMINDVCDFDRCWE